MRPLDHPDPLPFDPPPVEESGGDPPPPAPGTERTEGGLEDLLEANERYAAGFRGGGLSKKPRRHLAVVTCMDARLDPAKALGLQEGDAHVIRNAGAIVTDDVLRSLVISHWALETRQAVVIGHTQCGMLNLDAPGLRQQIAEGAADASSVDFLGFPDLEESIRTGVGRIRDCRALPGTFGTTGFVYDVGTGRLRRVA